MSLVAPSFLPFFVVHLRHTDGIRFCSVFLSSSTSTHPCLVRPAKAYGPTTPQETKTPRRFRFRSIQRVLPIAVPAQPSNRVACADSVDSNRTSSLCLLHRRPSPRNANTVRPQKPLRPQTRLPPPTSIRRLLNARGSLPKRILNPALPGTTSAVARGSRNPFLNYPPVTPACPSLGTPFAV